MSGLVRKSRVIGLEVSKDGVLFSGISIGKVLNEDGRIKVRLFSDPTQTFFINVVIDKASDVEAM